MPWLEEPSCRTRCLGKSHGYGAGIWKESAQTGYPGVTDERQTDCLVSRQFLYCGFENWLGQAILLRMHNGVCMELQLGVDDL